MRTRVKRRSDDDNKVAKRRCYFNSFEGAGDYFRGLKYVNRDLNVIDELPVIDQVSLIIFFILSNRSLEKANLKVRKVLISICRIDTRDLRFQFDNYLDENKKSIMITYLIQAIKELNSWSELSDSEHSEFMYFLEDVSRRIL